MDDNNNNIFDVFGSPSTSPKPFDDYKSKSTTILSIHHSNLPLINSRNDSYSESTSPIEPSSPGEIQRQKRRERALHDLGFVNPGPKNLVNVCNVPPRRLKTRQLSSQDKPCASKPLYDKSGLLIADRTDRCDCNRLKCQGCFLPCSNCQSPKCGLECRNLRTYSYEYRLYGTNKEIIQQ